MNRHAALRTMDGRLAFELLGLLCGVGCTLALAITAISLPPWLRPIGDFRLLLRDRMLGAVAGALVVGVGLVVAKAQKRQLPARVFAVIGTSLFGWVLMEPVLEWLRLRLMAGFIGVPYGLVLLLYLLAHAAFPLLLPVALLCLLPPDPVDRLDTPGALRLGALSLSFSILVMVASSEGIQTLWLGGHTHVGGFDPYSRIPFSLAIVGAVITLSANEVLGRRRYADATRSDRSRSRPLGGRS